MAKKDLSKDKINVLILGDHPLHLSGVAHALRDITNSLLITNKFRVIHLGAAIKHDDMRPIKPKEDWIIVPCEGFGTAQQVQQICQQNQVDIILMMSDPRFYTWLLNRDNEIRKNVPIVWFTIWDGLPYPIFNSWIWNSVDCNVAISELTYDLIKTVCPTHKNVFCMPHVVNPDIFKSLSEDECNSFKKQHLPFAIDKFIVFWNNRNGRRKNGGTLLAAFRRFLDHIGHDKAILIMKTDPIDPVGYNLPEIVSGYELDKQVYIIQEKFPEEIINKFYNIADVTVNIANAEGFGYSALESISAGTPIISTWTGGLRQTLCDNINNPTEWYGIPVFPASKAIIGSPELPFIHEDQCSEDDVVNALLEMHSINNRKQWGVLGRDHTLNKFNWNNFNQFWINLFVSINNTSESHPSKTYSSIRFEEFNNDSKRFESIKKPWDFPPSYDVNRTDFNNWKEKSDLFKK